jgi:hypothetical protein
MYLTVTSDKECSLRLKFTFEFEQCHYVLKINRQESDPLSINFYFTSLGF